MILTNEQTLLLHKCVAQGPLDKASVVIFGNEFGTAGGAGSTERCVNRFINEFKTRKLLKIGNEFFSTLEIDSPPVTSTFLQFISRLMLALKYKDERFFENLTKEGYVFLNNYIMNELYRTDTAIINLRPLPQTTERVWDYSNINEHEYSKMYNFKIHYPYYKYNNYRDLRLRGLKTAFDIAKDALILGSGAMDNKRAFFKTIYPKITFLEIILDENIKIIYSHDPRIILSKYYDNRSGIKLSGLREIYKFIVDNSLII